MIERKLFEKVDDNPGDYFGMLVEGYDSTYASVMKQADSDAQKLRDSWEKDGGKSLFDTLSELGYESDYEDSPYMFKDADGGNTIVFDFRPINSFEDYVTYYVVDKDNRIPDGWTKTKLMIDFWKDKEESLKEDYVTDLVAEILGKKFPMNKRNIKWLSNNGTSGEVEYKGQKFAFRKLPNGEYKVMRSSDAGWNWSETLFKDESLKEDKNSFRNWIEKKVGKQMSNMRPTKIGYKHGRPYYAIDFTDGTSDDYFIDFDKEEIEKCESLKEDKFVSRDKINANGLNEMYGYDELSFKKDEKEVNEIFDRYYDDIVNSILEGTENREWNGDYYVDYGRIGDEYLWEFSMGPVPNHVNPDYVKQAAVEENGFETNHGSILVDEEDNEYVQWHIHLYRKKGYLKEDKFVPQDKMSKKAQKELNDKKRGTWGNTNPVTKVQPNKKAYDRKRDKKANLDESVLAELSHDDFIKFIDMFDKIEEEVAFVNREIDNENKLITYNDVSYYADNLQKLIDGLKQIHSSWIANQK